MPILRRKKVELVDIRPMAEINMRENTEGTNGFGPAYTYILKLFILSRLFDIIILFHRDSSQIFWGHKHP